MTEVEKDFVHKTVKHIQRVGRLIDNVVISILERALTHDSSKTKDPEREIFCRYTSKLKDMDYGGDEYKECLKQMKPALDHHYANNRHHPEHFKDGVEGMNLVDLIEMICDWKASSERHKNGDLNKSIMINAERFGLSPQLVSVLLNTAEHIKELDESDR